MNGVRSCCCGSTEGKIVGGGVRPASMEVVLFLVIDWRPQRCQQPARRCKMSTSSTRLRSGHAALYRAGGRVMNWGHNLISSSILQHCLAITPSSRPYREMAYVSRECSPLLAGMLSSAVIVMACLYTVFRQCARSLPGRCFIVIWISQN